jgi:hypothetical protein
MNAECRFQSETLSMSPQTAGLSPDNDNRLANMPISLPMPSKLGVLRSEIRPHLKDHERLIGVWMCDIDWLWESTQNQHTKLTHPWFERVSYLRRHTLHNSMNTIDDAMEQLSLVQIQPSGPRGESSDEEDGIEGGE